MLGFGGLTLLFQDETFIKLKPTIVNLLFAAILGGGLEDRTETAAVGVDAVDGEARLRAPVIRTEAIDEEDLVAVARDRITSYNVCYTKLLRNGKPAPPRPLSPDNSSSPRAAERSETHLPARE